MTDEEKLRALREFQSSGGSGTDFGSVGGPGPQAGPAGFPEFALPNLSRGPSQSGLPQFGSTLSDAEKLARLREFQAEGSGGDFGSISPSTTPRQRPDDYTPPTSSTTSTTPGSPLDALGAEEASDLDILGTFFQERQLEEGIDDLKDEIERISEPLLRSSKGVSVAHLNLRDAFLDDGFDGASAYYAGVLGRFEAIGGLTEQRDGMVEVLEALEVNGSTPNQALRDWFRETPGDIPNINPENEESRDIISLFNQAMDAREGSLGQGERYDSGFSGSIGRNIDGFHTLRNEGKIDTSDGVTPDYSKFEGPDDYVDYLTLALRAFVSDEQIANLTLEQVEDSIRLEAPDLENQVSGREFSLVAAAILDRVQFQDNLSTAGDGALGEWLATMSLFSGLVEQ